jgi:hypothetical protein
MLLPDPVAEQLPNETPENVPVLSVKLKEALTVPELELPADMYTETLYAAPATKAGEVQE